MKILYIDMDDVLVDYTSGVARLSEETKREYEGRLYDAPDVFGLMVPVEHAVDSFNELCKYFDTYILSTAPWGNPTAWSDKLAWVNRYLKDNAYKRLILTHHKNLNKGDFLVDDKTLRGADKFEGELIQFGTVQYPDWIAVRNYLMERK